MGNVPSKDETSKYMLSRETSLRTKKKSYRDSMKIPGALPMDEPPPYSPSDEYEKGPPLPPKETNRPMSSNPSIPNFDLEHITPSPTLYRSHSFSSEQRPAQYHMPSAQPPGGGIGGFLSPDDLRHSRHYQMDYNSPMQPTYRHSVSASLARAQSCQWSSSPLPEIPTSSTSSIQMNPSPKWELSENQFEMLRKFDTVIIVDDSTSMRGGLWTQVREALAGIAGAAAQYDTDGIDIYFLNSDKVGKNLTSSKEVQLLFQGVAPCGLTPTGEKLEERLLEYFEKLDTHKANPIRIAKPKWVNFVVLTDGAPTDDPESVIVTAARRLDQGHYPLSQIGIQFVQIGTCVRAARALRNLDDALSNKYDIRDMVDTTPYKGKDLTTESLGKILLGGINRKIDRDGFKRDL